MSKRREVHRSVALVFPALSLVFAVGCASVASDLVSSTSLAPAKGDAAVETSTTATTSSTVVSTTTSTIARSGTALQLLNTIVVMNEYSTGYDRDLFKHWIDADGDSCNTREEVLIAESLTPAQVDAFGCKVIEGDWLSPFDNVAHTVPTGLDIDHMVPLKEAWDSGAWAWTPLQRQLFANDLSDRRPLIAVTAGVNRSKGEKDPSNWLPPNSAYLCTYLSDWVAIKAQWKLSMDSSEHGRIKKILTTTCAGTPAAAWGTKGNTTGSVGAPRVASPTTSVKNSAPGVVPSQSGLREVSPVRCKASEFGQRGQYKGIPYVCSNTRANGEPYATNYYFWRPA